MQRTRVLLMSVGALSLALTVMVSGCGGKTEDEPDGGGIIRKPTKTISADLKELVGKDKGTLSGRVTLDGATPDFMAANQRMAQQIEAQGDKVTCKMGDITQQQWKIGKDGGVANVYVWLRPPEGHYFKLDEAQVKVPEFVELKQPHCAFTPHATTLFPSYYDPATKAQKPTGQKLKILGSPEIQHNANLTSNNKKQAGGSQTISKGGERIVSDLKPDPNNPVSISCDIHKWMNATLWVFDHPFVAITDADGNYKIEGVPTDVPLQVVAWHGGAEWLTSGKAKGETMTLTKDTKKDFKVPAPK
jgi:hypothetical protein